MSSNREKFYALSFFSVPFPVAKAKNMFFYSDFTESTLYFYIRDFFIAVIIERCCTIYYKIKKLYTSITYLYVITSLNTIVNAHKRKISNDINMHRC